MSGASLSERAAALVEGLFEAPGDPVVWQRFLAAVGAEVAEGSVALLLGEVAPGGPNLVLGHGVDLDRVEPEDVRPAGEHPPPEVLPVGKVVPIETNDATFDRSHLYRSVLAARGLAPGPGLYVPLARNPRHVTGGLFVLVADPAWKPKADDVALLELLAPYVTLAARAGLRLHEEQSKASALLRSLARLRLGVVLLDARNRVSFANDSALEMLGLAGVAGPEEEVRRLATRALAALVKRETGRSTQTLSYPHPEDGRPLSLLVATLRWADSQGAERMRFTSAVFLSDPQGAEGGPAAALQELYGLSPGEARLAQRLAAGETLSAAAKSLGIKLSTARGVLRSVFEKTGTHRQSSLVRLILSGPGQVRRAPPGKNRGSS